MPRGPKGEKRPADVIGNAVHVMRIATGEIQDAAERPEASRLAQKAGKKGGKARAEALSSARKVEIARLAAEKRWGGKK